MSLGRAERPTRLGFVLAAVILTQLLVVIDFFALNLTLPPMARDFGVSATDLQFVISGYMIALGAFMIPAGRIADLIGRRRVTVTGVVVFGLSSLVCGVAPDEKIVVIFRVIEGIGAAMCFPVSIALITATFPAHRVQRTLGVVYGFAALGNALGPLVGGLLSEVSWRWVFLINVPLAALAAVWLQTSVPETVDDTASKRIDWLGFGLVSSGLIVTTLAVDNADNWGWASARTLGVLIGGLALLVAFLIAEARVEAPLVDLTLFREKAYAVIVSAGTLANCAFVVAIFAATLLLQNVRLLSPAESALAFLPMAIGCAIAGQTAGRLNRALPQWVAAGALAVGGLGLLILSTSSSWGVFLPGFGLVGLGLGLGWSYASVGTQVVVPPSKAAVASGVTLTALIALGGVALAVGATVMDQLAGAAAVHTFAPIQDVLLVSAVACLVGAVVAPLAVRMRREDLAEGPEPYGPPPSDAQSATARPDQRGLPSAATAPTQAPGHRTKT